MNITIIDDDAHALDIYWKGLESRYGHRFHVIDSLEEGQDYVKKRQPAAEVLIIDWNIPPGDAELDEEEALDAGRLLVMDVVDSEDKIPILILSGVLQRVGKEFRSGKYDYIKAIDKSDITIDRLHKELKDLQGTVVRRGGAGRP